MNAQLKPTCTLPACTKNCKSKCWYAQIQHGRNEHYRIAREAKCPPTGIPKGWGWSS